MSTYLLHPPTFLPHPPSLPFISLPSSHQSPSFIAFHFLSLNSSRLPIYTSHLREQLHLLPHLRNSRAYGYPLRSLDIKASKIAGRLAPAPCWLVGRSVPNRLSISSTHRPKANRLHTRELSCCCKSSCRCEQGDPYIHFNLRLAPRDSKVHIRPSHSLPTEDETRTDVVIVGFLETNPP